MCVYVIFIIKNGITIISSKNWLSLGKKKNYLTLSVKIQFKLYLKRSTFKKKNIISDTDSYYETLIKTLIPNHLILSFK